MVDTAADKLLKALQENWLTILQDGDGGKLGMFSIWFRYKCRIFQKPKTMKWWKIWLKGCAKPNGNIMRFAKIWRMQRASKQWTNSKRFVHQSISLLALFWHSILLLSQALEETKRTQHNRFKAKESNRYQTFVKDLNHVSAQYAEGETEPNTSISDVYATSDNLNDIDPITKGPLMKPVRNRHCNHIYGKDSIIESIQNNGRIRYIQIKFIVTRDRINLFFGCFFFMLLSDAQLWVAVIRNGLTLMIWSKMKIMRENCDINEPFNEQKIHL